MIILAAFPLSMMAKSLKSYCEYGDKLGVLSRVPCGSTERSTRLVRLETADENYRRALSNNMFKK